MGRRSKKLKKNEKEINELFSFASEKIKIFKQNDEGYVALVADWKKRLKVVEAFSGSRRESFDFKLLRYNQSSDKKEDIENSLNHAKDNMVNVFCYECREEDPVFVVSLLDRELLKIEWYQKIQALFHYVLIDYKESGFDYLLNHENEVWILRF